jgi:hypothetical protein
MNPSRDIEKLFDQFGGDAGVYQEIGRENEASHARTRWPLLATLDLSQPSIPNVGPRRDSLLPQGNDRSGENRNTSNGAAQTPAAAPLTRETMPRLFARANRKTIPPVANVTLPGTPVGAERFSALVDAVEVASNAEETAAPPSLIARLQAQAVQTTQTAQPSAFLPLAHQRSASQPGSPLDQPLAQSPAQKQPHQPLPRSQPLSTPAKLPSFATAFLAQRPQPAAKPSLPRVAPTSTAQAAQATQATQPAQPTQPASATPAAPESKTQSILGKLFRPHPHGQPAQETSATRPDSLQSMFVRLREPVVATPATPAPPAAPLSAPAARAPAPAAGSWLAKHTSRS